MQDNGRKGFSIALIVRWTIVGVEQLAVRVGSVSDRLIYMDYRNPEPQSSPMRLPLNQLKKIVIFILGGSVLLLGVIMIVTPGPALIVIPAGLAILAIEFAWARRLLKKAKRFYDTQSATWKHKYGKAKPGNMK